MKFRKKPVVIDATQWTGLGCVNPDVTKYLDENHLINTGETCKEEIYGKPCGRLLIEHGWVKTKEGGHIACPSDWIITGIKGEKYPCKPDIFEQTYERVE